MAVVGVDGDEEGEKSDEGIKVHDGETNDEASPLHIIPINSNGLASFRKRVCLADHIRSAR